MTTQPAPLVRHLALAALLLLGLLVRVAYLDVAPMDFHPTRQYRSALIARAESEVALAARPRDAQTPALLMRQAQGMIEPEVMETTAAWLYDTLGREDLRAPRLVSILAWLGGAAAMVWMLGLGGVSPWWALAAAGFVLFAPYGIDSSRAFMPDPLMVGLTMTTLALAMRQHRTPTLIGAVARLLLAAAALYVKPMAVFFIVPVILALDVSRLGLVRGVLGAALTCGVAAIPAGAHYLSLITSGNQVAQDRFLMQLLTERSFWTGWIEMVRRVIGWPALALSLVGLWRGRGPIRLALAAAWAGYVLFGLVFARHISTHDYYSLPLIPIAAASLALSVGRDVGRGFSRAVLPFLIAALIIAGLYPALTLRGYYGDVDRARERAADYERIGRLIQHSARVVSLDGSYGYPLAYHAGIVTSQLPLSIDRALSELVGRGQSEIVADFSSRNGEYFIGTLQPQLDAQPNLKELLEQRHVLLDRGGSRDDWRWVVYDLTIPAAQVSVVPVPADPADRDTTPPFGFVDAPGDPVAISDAPVLFQGWALDDTALARVDVIVRTAEGDTRLGQVSRRGRRADIVAAFPKAAGLDQAAWSFMLQPADIPAGTSLLIFRAISAAGAATDIGQRTIVRPGGLT